MTNKHKEHYSIKSFGLPKMAVKDVDEGSRTVSGFLNCYNFFDSYGDILVPGCMKNSIKLQGPKSQAYAKIKHALNHDLTQLPGKFTVLEERTIGDITGPYFESKLADTTLGNDTLKNYQAEIYDNHSIGYMPLDYEFIDADSKAWPKWLGLVMNPEVMEKRGRACLVKEIALYEGSTVAFGANALTPFLGMKSNEPGHYKKLLIDRLAKLSSTLRNGTQTEDMMKTFELQVLQIKQLLEDMEGEGMFEVGAGREKKTDIVTPEGIDWNKIASKIV